MKQSLQYKILAIIVLTFTSLYAFAQSNNATVIQIDLLTKVIGVIFTIGGVFSTYMLMRMSIRIADVEAKFNTALTQIEKNFSIVLRATECKLEDKISLSSKEIESKMATRHDIDNIKTISKLQHEITNQQLDGLKEQLKSAAVLYGRDNKG